MMLRAVFSNPSEYVRTQFSSDLFAGLTVAIMLIPQGMAYALLAGLPPIYGLYAALVPLFIYPFIGSSPFLSVGPVALVSIIVLTGLSKMAEPMSVEFIHLAILTSMVAGIIQVLLSVFRMGFLVNFLSQPVISGFTSAAALIIGVSQLKYLFGLTIPTTTRFLDTLRHLANNISDLSWIELAIGLVGLVVILVLKKVNRSLPGALIAVVLGILVVKFAHLDEVGVDTVGFIPSGLPDFQMEFFSFAAVKQVLPLALVICLISFIESLAIAKTLAAKHEHYGIDANKELLGLGLAKLVGSFFQGFPNTGSFTRSAINEQAGAKTGISSLIAGLIIALTLLFFTSTFYHLPKAVLAAVVISAVFGLIDWKEAKFLFKADKRDFIVLVLTFSLTLLLGIQKGVLVGVILSLLFILHKVSRPHHAVLGRIHEHDVYRNVERFKEAKEKDDLLILRYDDDIFFGNAEHFFNTVMTELKAKKGVKYLLLDFTAVGHIDSTGIRQFELMVKSVESKGVEVHLCSVKGPLRDEFSTYQTKNIIPESRIHWDIDNAIKDMDTLKNQTLKTV
ncbi:MAG: solute carrier family 26 protein [Bacteroidetes bacterium]|nr:solute carrier family 26 protein [Bacteroidota bacterium]MDA0972272.1 solute carrier family 26 protein [Bacteroidota bacterium]